jgi:uncharacterized membrane protein YfcA
VDPAIVGFGLGVGLLVGMTGIGGGSLMTPLLILVFGIKPVTAVGTDLAYGAVTKTVGGIKHLRQGTVDIPLSLWMGAGSVPAAVGGVYLLEAIQRAHGDDFDNLLITALAVTLLFCGIMTLARALFLKRIRGRERDSVEMGAGEKARAVFLGVVVGVVLGVTSAGSGALIAVGLIMLFRLVPQRVVGTDVFHAALLLWAAALAHIVAGNVDFALAGNILVGSIPGVWLGSHLSVRIPVATLRTVLALVLIGSGLGLLTKAGLGIPVGVLGAFPVAVALLVGGTAWRDRNRRRAARLAQRPARGGGGPRAAAQAGQPQP